MQADIVSPSCQREEGAKEVWGFDAFRSGLTSVYILGLQFKGLKEQRKMVPATECLLTAGVRNNLNKKTDTNFSGSMEIPSVRGLAFFTYSY